MPADILEEMNGELKHVALSQGASIFDPGQTIEHVYFPQTGLVSLLIVTKDGNSVEASTVGMEGAVGLHGGLGERQSFTRATVQVGGVFSTIPAARFEQIVHGSKPVADLITRYTEVLWAEAQQVAACNAVHDAGSRLCRLLLQSADRIASDHLPLTQEFLAQMLGVRRTTVTLLAQALQEKGIIRYSRGHIGIVDRAQLEKEACECYHVMQSDRLPLAIGISLYVRTPVVAG